MLEIGEVIELGDGKEYILVNKMELHNIKYDFLITNSEPREIVIGTEKMVDDEVVIDEIKDNEELDYILSKFVLTSEEN